MQRWGGRAAALSVALVAGLLVEAGPATAAPALVAAPLPHPVAAVTGAVDEVGPAAPVGPSPAQAAQAAFGSVGSLVAVVGPSTVGDVDRPVPTASLVKLYLAEGILSGARQAGVTVPAEDLVRIDAMLTSSDDPSASELWVTYDGPAVLADVVARYGLTATVPPSPDPGAWGSSRSSAGDLVRFLTSLPRLADPGDAARVLGPLGRTARTGADGFDQSFGLLSTARAGRRSRRGCQSLGRSPTSVVPMRAKPTRS